jgi:uncharacterized spore protein YtfJ
MEAETEQTFVERLAQRVGSSFGAATLFGEPIERGEITVIPVARAAWGFGGGSGSGPDNAGAGAGGGGGGSAWPVGYIELRDSQTRFRPIVDPRPIVLAAAFGLLAGLVAAARRR